MNKITFLFLIAFFAMACGPTGEESTSAIDGLDFTFEGPITPGTNTAQVEVNSENLILKPAGVSLDKVQSVKIKSVSFSTSDSTGFENMNSLVLQAVSDKSEMKSLAVLNPIKLKDGEAELTVGEDLDLLPYLSESVFYLLVDGGFQEMQMGNKTISGKITFTITATK